MSSSLPPMTKALAQRFRESMRPFDVASISNVRDYPGNPYGIEVATFGEALAWLSTKLPPDGWWNRVRDLEPGDLDRLDEILAFFHDRGANPNIDIETSDFSPEVSAALVARGFYPAEVSMFLYGPADDYEPAPPPGVTVAEVGKDQAGLVAELWRAGFEIADDDTGKMLADFRRGSFLALGNRLYVAYVEGTPAAMAALHVGGGIGFLNVGSTLPAFRERGCHTALTYRRVADAARAGCDLVIGHTASFGTASQNHMERSGLRIAFTSLAWQQLPAGR